MSMPSGHAETFTKAEEHSSLSRQKSLIVHGRINIVWFYQFDIGGFFGFLTSSMPISAYGKDDVAVITAFCIPRCDRNVLGRMLPSRACFRLAEIL